MTLAVVHRLMEAIYNLELYLPIQNWNAVSYVQGGKGEVSSPPLGAAVGSKLAHKWHTYFQLSLGQHLPQPTDDLRR